MNWKLVNALGYQVVWFACVAGAAHHSVLAGIAVTACFVLMVLGFGGRPRADLRLLPAVLLCGLLFDTTWIMLGWIDYSAPWPSQPVSPPWILCIWIAFALTFNHSLAFLKHRYRLAALFGAIAGPLAYWSAWRGMGAVHFEAPTALVLPVLGATWSVMLPLLVRISEQRSAPAATDAAA